MSRDIPFFEMFTELQLSGELRLRLAGAVVNGACIDQAGMSLALRLTTRAELGDAELEELKHLLMGVYGFRQVTTEVTCKAPSSQAAAAGSRPAASVPAAPSGSKGEKQAAGKVLMGKPIRIQPVPMKILDLKMGNATVAGKVFAFECRETRRPGMWRLSFDMTDYTNSVTVQKNLTEKEAQGLESAIKPGMWLCVQGKMEPTWDGKDIQLNPYHIQLAEHTERQDTAPEKRVELHLHTKMSNMDALTDTKEVVQQAIRWGHPAIAITDHGVAQSFPDAWHAAGDKIKILYGVEGYFVNNIDDRVVVHGPQDCSLDGEFVCFDIETTGLKVDREAITEIGAVVLKNGEITDRFQTFVNPNRRLTPEIIGLTGITDDMLKDAPQLKEALAEFLKFVDGRPLAAHNAEFDIGFIRAGCRKVGLDFQPTYVDSLILAQNLLPDLGKYKLDIVADRLELPNFNHHRASDDAATVGYMLIPFWKMLHERGIHTLQAVNREMEKLRPLGSKTNRFPKHIILIARNKVGLKNLYQMISASNLKYFKRVPTIPKSLLLEHREGIIVGSACEAGELFRAVADHKDWEELKRIASFYDYLEIQPLCNNAFMLRNGDVQSEEELREFNRTIVRLGEELGKPVCATGDVHFREPEDEVYRHILLASKKFPDANAPLPIYFKTTDEMLEEFAYLGKEKAYEVVVTNTQAIADQVETFPLLPEELFPPRLENSEEELNSLVWNKVHELYGEDPPKLIVDRLNVELGGILGKYDVVYMSAQKLVQRSLENGYLVGSRGSVGSSLVAYMSGITEVNSLPPHYRCPNCKHAEFIQDGSYGCGADMPDKVCPACGTPYIKDGFDIPFETFLGFGGGKVPDIDLNFSGEYQSCAHAYTEVLFGKGKAFRAGTVTTVADKTAYGYVYNYFKDLAKDEARAEATAMGDLTQKEIEKYVDEKAIVTKRSCEMERLAIGCTGVKRSTGQHPGGMIVLPRHEEIYSFTPIQKPANDMTTDVVTSHFEYHSIDHNLLKLDILGHDDPTMIRRLEDLTGLDATTIRLDDPDVMALFHGTESLHITPEDINGIPLGSLGVPEFGTDFAMQMLIDANPQNFSDLVRIAGLAHGTDVWLGNAQELIKSGQCTISTAICCRDDIMVYLINQGLEQEASFKIMEGVRKGKGLTDEQEQMMRDHNVPDWYIWSCKQIKYMFPKAHAAAYVMMAWRIAWYKVYHPLAYYAAYFSIRAKAFSYEDMCLGKERLDEKMSIIKNTPKHEVKNADLDLLREMKIADEMYARGYEFWPLDIYKAKAKDFQVIDGKIMPALTSIDGMGEKAAQQVEEAAKGEPFTSLENFRNRTKAPQACIEKMKELGIMGDLSDTDQLSFDFL